MRIVNKFPIRPFILSNSVMPEIVYMDLISSCQASQSKCNEVKND